MDLLEGLGKTDQLTSARAENAVLHGKVRELTDRVKELVVENEALKAEVELYRKDAALPSFSNLALGKGSDDSLQMAVDPPTPADAFVRSGNGRYPSNNEITLPNLHISSNPLCCSLSPDATVLASGGADSCIRLAQWGAALNPSVSGEAVVQKACSVQCQAPIICTSFSPSLRGILAAGCMDGSLHLVKFQSMTGQGLQANKVPLSVAQHHRKYIRVAGWSSSEPILATASADGTVQVYRAQPSSHDMSLPDLVQLECLRLSGPVESLCFHENLLICYARGTPNLLYFDLGNNFAQTKINLNRTLASTVTGGFDQHVSFAVMDLKPFQGKFLAMATDTSRNIVLDISTGQQIRNLYGHQNDGYSQPKVAVSANGQYVLGNTQDDSCICVWDISSSEIVCRMEGHSNPIRDMYSCSLTDTLVTTSFDKTTRLWFPPD